MISNKMFGVNKDGQVKVKSFIGLTVLYNVANIKEKFSLGYVK
ncbi:MAG: hypothetical protein RR409_10375 [Clostridium sp.]